ncbi:MAG TPA: EAL domain-containing protein [Candidatus Limnocylindrales bacterium]|nr:EAL domain-containing protein [Candidatus Limnocylindrales bacterium]
MSPASHVPTILVIDDDLALRELFSTALRRSSFEPVTAGSGAAGLEVVASQHVDLVVCDIGLPDMTGLDVVATLRAGSGTATLPVILVTGSESGDLVIAGLSAGADDFIEKPVRLDELVARVRAHLRTHDEWIRLSEAELDVRSQVIRALGALRPTRDPAALAEAVVREIADRSQPDFAGVLQVTPDGGLQELATYTPTEGVRRGVGQIPAGTAAQLLERARSGPWVEDLRHRSTGRGSATFERAELAMYASAPIFAGTELVGLLSIGIAARAANPRPNLQARLLASASDYSNVLTAVAGRAIADRRDLGSERLRLQTILDDGAFHTVFQPIVSLRTGDAVGYEALTRFADGMRPDRRFGEAWDAGIGAQFELAAVDRAIGAAAGLPGQAFVSVNVSPQCVMDDAERLGRMLGRSRDRVVLELTENLPIDDYDALRVRLRDLPMRGLAVDDAGAGFASLRHILELRPAFAKLDMSLVRGIDGDEVRQAMAAGLQYFAMRSECALIAEGVETEAEVDTLRRLGVELAQGYLFGQPAAAEWVA